MDIVKDAFNLATNFVESYNKIKQRNTNYDTGAGCRAITNYFMKGSSYKLYIMNVLNYTAEMQQYQSPKPNIQKQNIPTAVDYQNRVEYFPILFEEILNNKYFINQLVLQNYQIYIKSLIIYYYKSSFYKNYKKICQYNLYVNIIWVGFKYGEKRVIIIKKINEFYDSTFQSQSQGKYFFILKVFFFKSYCNFISEFLVLKSLIMDQLYLQRMRVQSTGGEEIILTSQNWIQIIIKIFQLLRQRVEKYTDLIKGVRGQCVRFFCLIISILFFIGLTMDCELAKVFFGVMNLLTIIKTILLSDYIVK